MSKLLEVKIKALIDESPDTSWLGEYTDKAEPWNICRHCGEYLHDAEKGSERKAAIEADLGDMLDDTNCLQYEPDFWANVGRLRHELTTLTEHDCPHFNREYNCFKPYAGGEEEGTEDYRKNGLQDFKRMEELNRGDWNFIGIVAKAIIQMSNGHVQVPRSAGIWGIESDSGDYLNEVGQEQLEELKAELVELNVDLSDWNELIDGLEVEFE